MLHITMATCGDVSLLESPISRMSLGKSIIPAGTDRAGLGVPSWGVDNRMSLPSEHRFVNPVCPVPQQPSQRCCF